MLKNKKIYYTISGHSQNKELRFHLNFLNEMDFVDHVFLSCSTQEMVNTFKESYEKDNYTVLLNEDYGYKKGCVVNVITPLKYIHDNYKEEDYYIISMEADAFFTSESAIINTINKLELENKHFYNMDFSLHGFNIDSSLQTINIFSKYAIENILSLEVDEELIGISPGMEDYWRNSINKKNSLYSLEKKAVFHTTNVLELRYQNDPRFGRLMPDRYTKYSVINMPNTSPRVLEETISFMEQFKSPNNWE